MRGRRGLLCAGLAGALLALGAAAMSPAELAAQNLSTLCAKVQLQLSQTATLERQAFSATLTINNPLATPLSDLQVQVSVANSSGTPTNSAFYVAVSSLTGTNAVDGTGVVQPNSSATAQWLLIPSSGTGGTSPAGQVYQISAVISGVSAGSTQTLTTFPVNITVQPQPLLDLQYVLPFEVFGQEPLTPSVAASPVPFPLGLRVINVGYGPANNFQVTSAQPQIVDNAQGLLVNFNLVGTVVNGASQPNSLLVTYGNLPAQGGVGLAEWTMTASLSGYFSSFTSSFTHAAALGGAQTSLIQSASTYTLIKDVLDDQPGHDNVPDFLVNYTVPRGSMTAMLDSGVQPGADILFESDVSTPSAVANLPGAISGTLGGTSSSLVYSLAGAAASGTWVYTYAPFSYGAAAVVSARRSDGKLLNAHNVWVSKHFVKSTLGYLYWINLFDFSPGTSTYSIQFSSGAGASPPAPIANLAAVSASSGAVALAWVSPGDSGQAGPIVGGDYYIQYSTVPATALSTASAQVVLTTTTVPGAAQSLLLTGLSGNATYYLAAWTANTEGYVSTAPAQASVFVPPLPPAQWTPLSISSASILASWLPGRNLAPAAYQVWLATAPAAAPASASPVESSTGAYAFSFGGLTPNTTYLAFADSPAGLAATQIGTAVSSAVAPSSAPFSGVSASSLTANWLAGTNPPGTQFLVQISTDPQFSATVASSSWTTLSSATMSGLTAGGVYYARVKARNWALAQTPYAALGSTQTTIGDLLPPRTTLLVSTPSFVASSVTYATDATVLTLVSTDDLKVVGDEKGVGVAATYVAVDTTVFSLYAGPFHVVNEGLHRVEFYSVDLDSNAEVTHSSEVAVDLTPPVTSTGAIGPSVVDSRGVVEISSYTLVALAAVDPLSNGVASGAAITYYVVDADPFSPACAAVPLNPAAPNGTCANEAYNGPFTLSGGTHTVYFFSEDNVGNQEQVNVSSFSVPIDVLPPRTSLAAAGPDVVGSSWAYVSTSTVFSLSAVDDAQVVGDGAGVGVAATYVAVDTAPYSVYRSSFTIQVYGPHEVSFYSVDLDSHAEVARSSPIYVAAPPSLAFVPPAGSTITVSTPTLSAVYYAADGISTATLSFSLDGVVVTTRAYVSLSSASVVMPFALSQGTHTMTAQVTDLLGLTIGATSTFDLDSIPPVTTLLIDGLAAGTTDQLLVSTDALSFVAVDTGTGVAATYYSVDASSFVVYASSFSLHGGTHAVSYFSRDYAGNTEARKSAFMLVVATGTPEGLLVQILWPGGVGVEQAVGLTPQVLGITQGPGADPWTLGVAAGTSTAAGLKTIVSGSGDVYGALGAWNTAGATGPQTLQLLVSDALGGTAISTAPAYAGAPVYAGSLGSGFADWNIPVLHEPSGLAVRSDGNLWIDMGSGELILMNSSGTVLAQEGGGESRAHDRDGSSLRLNDPHGLALDSTGYLYVADTGNNRVIKLSPDGHSVLTQYNGNDIKRPYSVAVDTDGAVYIGDSGDGRVAVFSNEGTFQMRFGVASSSAELRGLALTYRGLWVSDRGRNELDLWSRAGVLLQTITGAQAPAGELTRVRTLSADALGALYVIESDRDRVQKFDPLGDGLLAFGSPAQNSREERWWHRYLTSPSAASIGPDGTLWVADEGADRLVRFALPGAPGTSQAPAQPPPGSTPPVTRNIDPDDGGSAWRSDGTGVQVPPGNVGLTVGVGASGAGADIASRQSQRQTQSLSPAASEVDFEPSGAMFASPVTLTLAYDPAQVAQASLDETALQVYWWNANAKQWVALPSTVDTVAKVVRAQTSHFSLYQAMAPAVSPLTSGGGAYDAFGLRAHYAFPNPSRRGASVDFRIQTGLADSVDLRVYSLTGRKVLSTTISNVQFLDDGNGLGSQDTYDYLWNVGGVGSGVYTYVFVAHKSGQHDITASGRIGVIK